LEKRDQRRAPKKRRLGTVWPNDPTHPPLILLAALKPADTRPIHIRVIGQPLFDTALDTDAAQIPGYPAHPSGWAGTELSPLGAGDDSALDPANRNTTVGCERLNCRVNRNLLARFASPLRKMPPNTGKVRCRKNQHHSVPKNLPSLSRLVLIYHQSESGRPRTHARSDPRPPRLTTRSIIWLTSWGPHRISMIGLMERPPPALASALPESAQTRLGAGSDDSGLLDDGQLCNGLHSLSYVPALR
jgi:hypothetical protein